MRWHQVKLFAVCAFVLSSSLSYAAEVHVAVAANFLQPLEKLQSKFEQDTGHTLLISSGSTGQLYAQIKNGAPFDVFLGADTKRPKLTIEDGVAVADTLFTYAKGVLVLWSAKEGFVDDKGEVLKTGDFSHVSIANPKTAPYGAAAMEVLSNLGLADSLSDKIVEGQSITQTYQFVATGNAELGFVALSQLKSKPELQGSYWMIDSSLYQPIEQGAVLLKNGAENAAAQQFLAFLQSDAVKASIVNDFGYTVP